MATASLMEFAATTAFEAKFGKHCASEISEIKAEFQSVSPNIYESGFVPLSRHCDVLGNFCFHFTNPLNVRM